MLPVLSHLVRVEFQPWELMVVLEPFLLPLGMSPQTSRECLYPAVTRTRIMLAYNTTHHFFLLTTTPFLPTTLYSGIQRLPVLVLLLHCLYASAISSLGMTLK